MVNSRDESTQEVVPEVDAFLDEIEVVCRKHGMSISHEDGHGAFIVERFHEFFVEWLRNADDARAVGGKKL